MASGLFVIIFSRKITCPRRVLHSRNDQVAKVNGTSVYFGYMLALALVGELDGLPCEVSRDDSKQKQ
jgi:hypothetical protein